MKDNPRNLVRICKTSTSQDQWRSSLEEILLNRRSRRQFQPSSLYPQRSHRSYGQPMDIGHSAQNVCLQAEALGLGTCAIGAFDGKGLIQVLDLPAEKVPMYIMPVVFPV